jgi:hypothetical protein
MKLPGRDTQWQATIGLLLAGFAFSMSAWLSAGVFERLPHLEDEVAYLYQARIFAGGHLVIDSPQPQSAFWQPFVVDSAATGKRFGKYPPGWPALLALGLLLGHPWLVNACLSALTVLLVYRLGSRVFDPDVGLCAAVLLAFSPATLLLDATLMPHTAALFLATLSLYAYWRMQNGNRSTAWGACAGLALGALAATRPLTAVVLIKRFRYKY